MFVWKGQRPQSLLLQDPSSTTAPAVVQSAHEHLGFTEVVGVCDNSHR